MNLYRQDELDEFYSILKDIREETSLDILSITDLLQEKLVFLTGGNVYGCPILTFPNRSQSELTQEKYKKLIAYLTRVPSKDERQYGFILIIDRRLGTWNAVKSIIGYVENYFPYSIRCIYLLRPNSWMQRAVSYVTISTHITCSHQLIICATLYELHSHVNLSQLSKDLGGMINFRLFEWIEQRATIEKLAQSIHELNETLLAFINECHDIEFPNSVEAINKMLNQHSIRRTHFDQELQHVKTWGHSLLCIIQQHHQQSSISHNNTIDKHNDIEHLALSTDQSAHVRSCTIALIHIDRIESTLLQFWSIHKARLDHCLALRHFEQHFKEIQCTFMQLYNEIVELLGINTNQLIVDYCRFDNKSNKSREKLDEILIQLDDLSQRAQMMISHATRLANDGLALMMEQQKQQLIAFGNDSIEPKRQELEDMKKKLIEQIDEKRHSLKLLKIYIDKLGSINDWCIRGKDMLAMHSIHLSNDKAIRSLTELELFLTDLSIMNIEELQHTNAPEPLRSMINQVFNRVHDIRDLCEKRCEQLRHLIKPVCRPVQSVHPSPFQINEPLHFIDSNSSSLPQHMDEYDTDPNRFILPTTNESKINQNAKMDKKQRHVITELLVTEQVYVEELRNIIDGYMIKFDDPEQNRSIPPIVLQNKTTLFSNLPDIYAFHATSFLRDLQQIYNDLLFSTTHSIGSAIASCFIKRRSSFKLYERYVLNKSQSERLWQQYCCGHTFFTKIQNSLGHRLPLDSYLLKPIQRIAQYQLLLKEMIKYTCQEQERIDLQEALAVILNILSHMNDVMHSAQIVGYPDQLCTLGQIRLRGENCLVSKEKRRGAVYTRSKTSTRDIFLFERVILLCKKKDEGSGKTLQYQFKEMIKIVDIAVCTYSKTDCNKFEILLKDYSYVIQLSTNGETNEATNLHWINTIKSCIIHQTDQRRAEIKHRSASLDHAGFVRRRRLQNRKFISNQVPESDDEQTYLPKTLIDIKANHIIKSNKLTTNNTVSII